MQGTGTARSLRLRHQLLHGDALDRVTFGALPFGGVAHGQYVHRHERGGQVERLAHAGGVERADPHAAEAQAHTMNASGAP